MRGDLGALFGWHGGGIGGGKEVGDWVMGRCGYGWLLN